MYIRGASASIFNQTLTQRRYSVDSDGEILESASEDDDMPPQSPVDSAVQAEIDSIRKHEQSPGPNLSTPVTPGETLSITPLSPDAKSESSPKAELKQEEDDDLLKQQLAAVASQTVPQPPEIVADSAGQAGEESPDPLHAAADAAQGQSEVTFL